MPIVQISRIQHRRGKRTDLPQLAAGELGYVIDEQRLFIGLADLIRISCISAVVIPS